MNNQGRWEEKTEKKYRQREKRKNRKMRVSGKSVFGLKKIITRKVGR